MSYFNGKKIITVNETVYMGENINLDATPNGTDTSTNILAYTEDKGIYVGTDTGHWYYWNGSTYADGGIYQAPSIPDGTIVASMLAESLTPFGGEIGSSPTAPYNDANTFPNKNATYRIDDVSAVSNLPTSSGSGILITKLGISSNNANSCQLFITSENGNRKPNLYIRSKYNQWSSWSTYGIDGEEIGPTSSYTSANDLPYNKVFRLNNDNILTDLPTNNYAVFYRYNFNEKANKDVCCDFFVDVNTQKFYYRTRFINTYSSWQELLTTNDINFIIASLTTDYTITQGAWIGYSFDFVYYSGHDSLSLYEKDIRQYQNQEIDVWFNADSNCYTVMIDGSNNVVNSVQSNGMTYQKYRMFVPKSAVKIQISCRDSIPKIEKATINTLPVIENINASFHPTSIFHDWAFVGDSLTAGEIQAIPTGQTEEVGVTCDNWSYPANIEKKLNITRTMYAIGGYTAQSIYTKFKDNFLTEHKEIYVIGLGQNDKWAVENNINGYTWGSVATDINDSDYTQNANSYAGYMGRIIQCIRANNPKCFIFVMPTLMQKGYSTDCMTVLNDLCSHFSRCYLLDNTQYWKYWKGWTDGHLDAIGYNFVADYVINSIDKIIINNESEFRNVPFIFTNYEAGL